MFDEYHKLKLIDFGLCAKPKVSVKIKYTYLLVLYCTNFHLIFIELSYIHFENFILSTDSFISLLDNSEVKSRL